MNQTEYWLELTSESPHLKTVGSLPLDICPDALRRWCEAGEIIQEDMLSIA